MNQKNKGRFQAACDLPLAVAWAARKVIGAIAESLVVAASANTKTEEKVEQKAKIDQKANPEANASRPGNDLLGLAKSNDRYC
jgi:hypothetical protein